MDFKDQWDVETALKILQHKTVDSKLWAEAAEWLLMYGPPEISEMLLKASGQATKHCFPELHERAYSNDGQPVYDLNEIAQSLGITKEEAREILAGKEALHKMQNFFNGSDSGTTH